MLQLHEMLPSSKAVCLHLICMSCNSRGMHYRLIPGLGLPAFPKAHELSRLQEQVMTAKQQLLQLDLTPLSASNASQSRRPRNAAIAKMLHAPMCA